MKIKDKLVSIIIPSFNSKKTINQCLKSISNQTYKNYEVLFIDNNSNDNSDEIAKKLAIELKLNFRFFKTKFNTNSPAIPRNIGIQNANGDYIAFLDSDDFWKSNKLEKSIYSFTNETDIIFHDLEIINQSKKLSSLKNIPKFIKTSEVKNNFPFELIENGNKLSLSSVVVKKNVFSKCGLFNINNKLPEDFDMWIRFQEKGLEFKRLKKAYGYYRIGDNNLSLNNQRDFTYMFALINEYKDIFRKNYNNKIPSWICLTLANAYYREEKYKEALNYSISAILFPKIKIRLLANIFKRIICSYLYMKKPKIMRNLVKFKNFLF